MILEDERTKMATDFRATIFLPVYQALHHNGLYYTACSRLLYSISSKRTWRFSIFLPRIYQLDLCNLFLKLFLYV